MNFELTASHEKYFGLNGVISFEEVLTSEDLDYLATLKKGYDLWRNDKRMEKIVLNKDIGKLIFALTQKRPLRLLFDRIVTNETIDLGQLSFQGVVIGVLISLNDGLVTFFSLDKQMHVESPQLFIAYGESNVRYIFCEADPHAPRLKRMGYAYGDRLKAEDFPYLYR